MSSLGLAEERIVAAAAIERIAIFSTIKNVIGRTTDNGVLAVQANTRATALLAVNMS